MGLVEVLFKPLKNILCRYINNYLSGKAYCKNLNKHRFRFVSISLLINQINKLFISGFLNLLRILFLLDK